MIQSKHKREYAVIFEGKKTKVHRAYISYIKKLPCKETVRRPSLASFSFVCVFISCSLRSGREGILGGITIVGMFGLSDCNATFVFLRCKFFPLFVHLDRKSRGTYIWIMQFDNSIKTIRQFTIVGNFGNFLRLK